MLGWKSYDSMMSEAPGTLARKGLDCYGNNLAAFIESYGQLVKAYRNIIDANEEFIKSSPNVERAAEIAGQYTIITNELINLQANHPKKLKSIVNCQ
nr:hypothetical protein HAGR004_41010 [Bdellovibrio sp. HAGR004]